MKYEHNKAPKKKWLRRIVGRLFWGAIVGIDLLTITLFITMYFNNYSVFWLMWNTISVVWQSALVGAMLGLSLEVEYLNSQIKKLPMAVGAFLRSRITDILALPPLVVKHLREGTHKNVRI